MSQQMEVRLARLEGAYEQIDRRLVDLRQDLDRSFAGIEQRFAAVDQKLTWIIGLIVATSTTTILTIVFHH
jgi:hypothetical protein